MSNNLLLENFLIEKNNIITESVKGEKKVFIKDVVFQRANTLNQNGRIYPREVLEPEVENFKKLISERSAVGELDHPDRDKIHIANVSHLITELYWKGDTLLGSMEILPTPMGEIVKNLISYNITLGVSSRALGEVKREYVEKYGDYVDIVQKGLVLITFDIVSNPSTKGATFNQNKLSESKNLHIDKQKRLNELINILIEKIK